MATRSFCPRHSIGRVRFRRKAFAALVLNLAHAYTQSAGERHRFAAQGSFPWASSAGSRPSLNALAHFALRTSRRPSRSAAPRPHRDAHRSPVTHLGAKAEIRAGLPLGLPIPTVRPWPEAFWGYQEQDLTAVLGGNWLRLAHEAWKARTLRVLVQAVKRSLRRLLPPARGLPHRLPPLCLPMR
jgi:hypothetical protein